MGLVAALVTGLALVGAGPTGARLVGAGPGGGQAAGQVDAGPPPPDRPAAATPQSRFRDTVSVVALAGETRGSDWSVHPIRVANQGTEVFRGELIVSPIAESEAEAPAPAEGEAAAPVAGTVYRAAVEVGPGAGSTVTVDLASGSGRRQARLVDAGGAVVGESVVNPPDSRLRPVAYLARTRVLNAFAGSRFVSGPTPLITSAGDFPRSATDPRLVGLAAVVIAGFDSADLDPAQVETLRRWVAHGGSLIIGSGADWQRTVTPLPEDLTPLRPTAAASASLAPVADLAGLADAASAPTATVATGPVGFGNVVLDGPDGTPLVITARVGSGRIVQTTYDLVAELEVTANFTSPVPRLAREFALGQAERGDRPAVPSPSEIETPDMADAAAGEVLDLLEQSSRPGLVPGTFALLAYAALAGPILWLRLRRRGSESSSGSKLWRGVSMVAVGGALAAWGCWSASSPVGGRDTGIQVQVQEMASDGSTVVRSWYRLSAPTSGQGSTAKAPDAAHTSVSRRPEPGPRLADLPDLVGLDRLTGTGAGEPDRIHLGDPAGIELVAAPAWSSREVTTTQVVERPPHLESALRLAGGRVVGTVTNTGPHRIEHLRLVIPGGASTQITRSLAPGETVEVAASAGSGDPSATAGSLLGQPAPSPASVPAAAVLDLAAGRARTEPGDVVLVGVTRVSRTLLVDGSEPDGPAIAALSTTVRLGSADSLGAGMGTGIEVCDCRIGGSHVIVYDAEVPPWITALAVTADTQPPFTPETDGAVEVFDWSSRSWRVAHQAVRKPIALDATERREGLVRIRVLEPERVGNPRIVIPAAR